jgi:hypothetical protein
LELVTREISNGMNEMSAGADQINCLRALEAGPCYSFPFWRVFSKFSLTFSYLCKYF